jgi:glycosyltransferase involved in cell wall biosynthesis
VTAKRISVIIPNYNGARTIGECLAAVFSSDHGDFEVIVVDDCSTDGSVEVIRRFPCTLTVLERNSGAAVARNTGARNSSGEVLFFIDSDCVVDRDTLSIADRTIAGHEDTVFGGTYSRLPFDDNFFAAFQSVFIHYSETKSDEPDYVATHAMVIGRALFEKSGGFCEDFMPILEDVEFSHRLRRSGIALRMNPEITVSHIFNFNAGRSLGNAFRKTKYWTVYSLRNRDLFYDSGTASRELKFNVLSFFCVAALGLLFSFSGNAAFPKAIPAVCFLNLFYNRRFISSLYETKGFLFALLATGYYTAVYPLAIGAGALAGLMQYRPDFGGRSPS